MVRGKEGGREEGGRTRASSRGMIVKPTVKLQCQATANVIACLSNHKRTLLYPSMSTQGGIDVGDMPAWP
jgi:hypothetical protein